MLGPIAVSETWMSHNSNNFNIPGYDAYHIVRENKKGGGVACYVKQELTSKGLTSKSLYHCLKMEISQTFLTIAQFHFYITVLEDIGKIIQRATTTILEYK